MNRAFIRNSVIAMSAVSLVMPLPARAQAGAAPGNMTKNIGDARTPLTCAQAEVTKLRAELDQLKASVAVIVNAVRQHGGAIDQVAGHHAAVSLVIGTDGKVTQGK